MKTNAGYRKKTDDDDDDDDDEEEEEEEEADGADDEERMTDAPTIGPRSGLKSICRKYPHSTFARINYGQSGHLGHEYFYSTGNSSWEHPGLCDLTCVKISQTP